MGFFAFLFGYRGRINRLQYWSGCGLLGILNMLTVFMALGPALAADDLEGRLTAMQSGGLILAPLRLAGGAIALSLQWKRFHDRGKSGWLSLIPFVLVVPIVFMAVTVDSNDPMAALGTILPLLALLGLVGLWFFIELGLLPGQPMSNKYGDPPGGGLQVGMPNSGRGGPVDWDAATRAPATSNWAGAEAALEQAIAERRQAPRGPQPAEPAMPGRPAPAQRPIVSPAAPAGFGKRGL